MPYDWKAVEVKWQKRWEEARIFEADPLEGKPKFFVTFPYPYMNAPLHIGGGFTANRVDVYARFKRMQGFNVLFPFAWHWSGQPIVAAAERLARGDPAMVHMFREIDKVPEGEIKKFVDSVYMARYYTNEGRQVVKRMGFSVDWRRDFHTSSLEPTYSRFIEWQYARLKERGYVVKGTHPVVWCPKDQSPTGDHDRLEGEGVTWEEYTLIKFPFNGAFLTAATFRPETLFGATNLWLNPEGVYVKVKVDGEPWIVSKEAAQKLQEQRRRTQVIEEFRGAQLLGRVCRDPLSGRSLPILPASFVDPASSSGVVYSVPAHAPYDWVALRDLQKHPETLERFGVEPELVKRVQPISLINVEEGVSEYPAVEVCERLGVKDQMDPACEEATRLLYKTEFHTGVLKENCGKFAGLRVSEAKAAIIEEFRRRGIADSLYDLPQPVICRCTTRCIIKVLEEQWFLKYSDEAWKALAREALAQARIYPEAAKAWFESVINWLREWPCARKTGLGTPMPGAEGWIVETLSDSTIYMAYYTIRKHIQQHRISADQLKPEVFDYIFLGEGDVKQASRISGISAKVLEEMRREFLYWYPVDLRVSGKDLVGNHLTFYIFHHVAVFPPGHWPKGIGVNGFMMMEGAKMSKSKGNVLILRDALDAYGADVVRAALASCAEGLDDPDWRTKNAESIRDRIQAFHDVVSELLKEGADRAEEGVDRWLISTLQRRVAKVTEALDELNTRTAFQIGFYDLWNDLRWYLKRVSAPRALTVKHFLDVWVSLLAPFIPHLAEELSSQMGHDGFASQVSWPKPEDGKIDLQVEVAEEALVRLIEDARKVLKLIPQAHTLYVYPASPWKMDLFLELLAAKERGEEYGAVMRRFVASKPALAKEAGSVLTKLVNLIYELGAETAAKIRQVKEMNEFTNLSAASGFLEKELGVKVEVHREDEAGLYDPRGRAKSSLPFKPAIYLE